MNLVLCAKNHTNCCERKRETFQSETPTHWHFPQISLFINDNSECTTVLDEKDFTDGLSSILFITQHVHIANKTNQTTTSYHKLLFFSPFPHFVVIPLHCSDNLKQQFLHMNDAPCKDIYNLINDDPCKEIYIHKNDAPCTEIYIHIHDAPCAEIYSHTSDVPCRQIYIQMSDVPCTEIYINMNDVPCEEITN